MNINYKKLIKSILIPLVLGGLVALLTKPGTNYKEIIQPSFAPPGIVFPIAWSILYILMGISSYLVDGDEKAIKLYNYQLILNLLWSFVFFTFKLYLLSFIWIIVLIILVLLMIKEFYKINKTSAYLQIPYLLWLIFASILSYAIFKLN